MTPTPPEARRRAVGRLDLHRFARYGEHLLWLLDEQFGSAFTEHLLDRIEGTTLNTRVEGAHKLSNCLAYLLARSVMDDPADDLVINLGPDEAWHAFIHFTAEYSAFCDRHAGEYLHHDPAGEAAFVNSKKDTLKTIALFKKYNIPFDPNLWCDYLLYPHGADAVRGGFVARQAPMTWPLNPVFGPLTQEMSPW